MSKITVFHGTSADNLKSIRKEGLKRDCGKLWLPSEDAVYFWSVPAVNEMEGNENLTDPEPARRSALDSAQFALIKAKDCRVVLVECELDENELEPDTSCDNMAGAVCIRRDVKPSEIKSIEVSNDLSLFKGYFMSFTLNRDLSAIELTPLEKRVAKCFEDSCLCDDMNDIIELKKVRI